MGTNSSRATGFNLVMINAFVYISSSVYGPFLGPFYSSRGISPIQIGILLTIGSVASILIQPLWAMLSDRTGRRKSILSLVVLGSGFTMFSYYLGNTFTTFFIATVLVSVFTTSIVPLSDAIIIRVAGKINFEFAIIRMGGTIGFAIFVVLAGSLLKLKPNSLFSMGFIGYMLLLIFVLQLPAENKIPIKDNRGSEFQRHHGGRINALWNIFETNMVFFILAFALLSQIGLSFYWSFLGVYVVDLGYGQDTVGWLNCASALSELPALIFINRLIKKFGSMKILFVSCIILSLRIFLVTRGSLPFILLAQILQGISYMTVYFSCAVYINDHVKPGKQSQGQSTLAIMQMGVGSVIGNVAGGYLVDALGIEKAYTLMSVVILITTLMIITIQAIYRRNEPAHTGRLR